MVHLVTFDLLVAQLLQNIMKSTELHFPLGAKVLSTDCKDLCQKLLRRNPGKQNCIAISN